VCAFVLIGLRFGRILHNRGDRTTRGAESDPGEGARRSLNLLDGTEAIEKGNETSVSHMSDGKATESWVFIWDQADAEQFWSVARRTDQHRRLFPLVTTPAGMAPVRRRAAGSGCTAS
jgi:hypothetical protein